MPSTFRENKRIANNSHRIADNRVLESYRDVPANQVSLMLYEHDPMHTACNANSQMGDEYNRVSKDVIDLVRRGQSAYDAVSIALHGWFGSALMHGRVLDAVSQDVDRVMLKGEGFVPILFAYMRNWSATGTLDADGRMSTKLFLPFPGSDAKQGIQDCGESVATVIRAHMKATAGKLQGLGYISAYIAYAADGHPTAYDVTGAPTWTGDAYSPESSGRSDLGVSDG
jgi:hypothetical protein